MLITIVSYFKTISKWIKTMSHILSHEIKHTNNLTDLAPQMTPEKKAKLLKFSPPNASHKHNFNLINVLKIQFKSGMKPNSNSALASQNPNTINKDKFAP